MSTSRIKELAVFYEKLGQLEHAGVPILEGLPLATMQVSDPLIRRDLGRVNAALRRGATLSEAFSRNTQVFPPLHLSLINVGEAQGRLDQVLKSLAEVCERDYKARKEVLSALLYPAFLMVAAFLLPPAATWYTKGFFAYLKDVFGSVATFALPVGVVVVLLYLLRSAPATYDRLKLGLPLVGKLLSQLAYARFSRSLAALISGGVEMKAALQLAIAALGNRYLESRCAPATAALSRGETLAQCLIAAEIFPPDLIQRVVIGERAGQLDKTLDKAAEYYDFEAQRSLKTLVQVLPVLVFLLVAVRVAQVVIGFYSGYIDSIDKATTGF
jgi:type II secretory pathway component PulF